MKAYELPEPKEPCYVQWPTVPFQGPMILCETFEDCPECAYCFEYYHRYIPLTQTFEVQITQITAIGENCSSMQCRYFDLFEKGLVLIYNTNQMGWPKYPGGSNGNWAGSIPGACMRRMVNTNQNVIADDLFFDENSNSIKMDYETEYLLNNPDPSWSWYVYSCDNTTCCVGYHRVHWHPNGRVSAIEFISADNYPTNCLPLGVCFPVCDVVKFSKEGLEKISIDSYDTSEFKIYPNPANTFINIEFFEPSDDNFDIQIYDINNKLVETIFINKESKLQNTIVDISKLSRGTYFIKTSKQEFNNKTLKFIKN